MSLKASLRVIGALALFAAFSIPGAQAVVAVQPQSAAPPPPPAATGASSAVASPEVGAPVGSSPSMTGQSTQPTATKRRHRFLIGPELGAFIPTSSKLQNRFGSAWYSIGIGIGQIKPANSPGQYGLDLDLIARTGPGTHAYIAPIGLQYRLALAQAGSSIPYVGASIDLVLADIRSPQDGAHSGLMETGGASVFVGTTLGPRSYIEARYLALGSVQGFNLSGLNLTAGYRF